MQFLSSHLNKKELQSLHLQRKKMVSSDRCLVLSLCLVSSRCRSRQSHSSPLRSFIILMEWTADLPLVHTGSSFVSRLFVRATPDAPTVHLSWLHDQAGDGMLWWKTSVQGPSWAYSSYHTATDLHRLDVVLTYIASHNLQQLVSVLEIKLDPDRKQRKILLVFTHSQQTVFNRKEGNVKGLH